MKIHSSARFEDIDLTFHDCFVIEISESQVEGVEKNITNLAISKFKVKCTEYFGLDFNNLIGFEVYFYNSEGKEIQIFKKVK